MQSKFKVALGISILGYVVSLITARFLPGAVNLLVPTTFSLGSLIILSRNHSMEVKRLNAPNPASESLPNVARTSSTTTTPSSELESKDDNDPFWGPISEYIHVIEETMISEGQKNTLDNEIVEKTLSLLARVGRLIPQLKELNDANMNHNIQRLIFKDLNGAINPFLKLGGEAKRLNRRLLLTGIKDINSKLSAYVETIEQKDLIELQTRMELIQQRYRSED
ncbi:hypothetical protein GQF01_33405 [Paenibacillus sp. 5J-6]|uniref:5-bromo-4-chloroindolyl phosphate hydrolysis protein n=1 Tax=Paenibacillus silvestris TaxID=2606219 RepID=A0A6L8VCS7_9BACL|nr:hypothetical protein [Paenibacillus silvestris]MZQ87020.1 hypothetical protein [Paenibacillus silvestris]